MTTFLAFALMAVSLLLIMVVLVQRGRGGGLSGAFGAGGGSTSAFGTKTGDVFTTVTVVLFVVFMLLAIGLIYKFQSYQETIKGGLAPTPTASSSDSLTPTTSPASGLTAPLAPTPSGPLAPMTPTTTPSK